MSRNVRLNQGLSIRLNTAGLHAMGMEQLLNGDRHLMGSNQIQFLPHCEHPVTIIIINLYGNNRCEILRC